MTKTRFATQKLATAVALGIVLVFGAACAAKSTVPEASVSAPAPLPDEELRARVVADYDAPPQVDKITPPRYPRNAFQEGIQGTVVLEIVIDESGAVGWWRVIESIPGLDAAAIACVLEWRFAPATRAGIAVAAMARAPVTFTKF